MRRIFFLFVLASMLFITTVFAQRGTQSTDPGACDLERRVFDCVMGHSGLEEVEKLLDAGHDVNGRCQDKTALMGACSVGIAQKPEIPAKLAQLLLERGADPNIQDNDGETALMQMVKTGHHYSPSKDDVFVIQIMELLLGKGADVNTRDKKGKTALQVGLSHNNKNISDFFAAYLKRQKQSHQPVQPAGGTPPEEATGQK